MLPNRVGFIIKRRGAKAVHIWDGKDTACHMYSCGQWEDHKYEFLPDAGGRTICANCRGVTGLKRCDPVQSDTARQLPLFG